MRMDPAALERRLANGRAAAEVRMTTRARARRKVGETKVGNRTVGVWQDVHTGLFRLAAGQGASTSVTHRVGETEYRAATPAGHWPIAVDVLRDDDFIEVLDGTSAGKFYRILDTGTGDQQTARRFPLQATRRPEGW